MAYTKKTSGLYTSLRRAERRRSCAKDVCELPTGRATKKTLLTFGGNPYQISLLDVASHRQTLVLKHPSYHLLYGRFSPDNRWVAFTARIEASRAQIVIAPLDGPKPVPESAWIAIADVGIDD